jgi:uncharacterized membrane-anchored protein YitT (DUF2179 family)
MVALGSFLCAVSINTFLLPHHLLSSGLTGIAMILHFLYNSVPIGLTVGLFNIPLFLLAFKLLDRKYFFCALYGAIVFSLAIDSTKWLSALNVVDDTLLAAIYGGVLSGIGSGLVFRVNGSSGGTDTIAALFRKFYNFNVSYVGLGINCGVMLVAAFFFGAKPAMYTLLSIYVAATITDKVVHGINRKRTVLIISEQSEQISNAVLTEIGRGVTYLQGQGAYTNEDKKVLLVAATLVQIAKIKLLLQRIDPNAFMIVQDAVEISGDGFSSQFT